MDTKKSVNSSFDYKPLSRVNSSSFRFEAMESLKQEKKNKKLGHLNLNRKQHKKAVKDQTANNKILAINN